GVEFVELDCQPDNALRVVDSPVKSSFFLRSERQLTSFWRRFGNARAYLDITGLPHHVWAPLIRAAIAEQARVAAIYVEPSHYAFSPSPTENEIFDLSERISGIAPLPGFTVLAGDKDEDTCLIALLGFEGTRFAHIREHVQAANENIIPVVGVPGFRPEYVFHAYLGNRVILSDTKAWRNVRFARANCPFSMYFLLEDISRTRPRHALKIAPIGTKPQALGAVLFSLLGGRVVELVYDHPIRKAQRTTGVDRLLVYDIYGFARN
ncbi:MAG TPA: hypothetical protein VND45_15265, partial [Thermoanaerobaculia bacterium]|nr:hypothetical protein [Thermoanaerobaculia bacterium]